MEFEASLSEANLADTNYSDLYLAGRSFDRPLILFKISKAYQIKKKTLLHHFLNHFIVEIQFTIIIKSNY